ncbi:MAG: sugar ABC transporter substrate-binding protein [Chloroflexi bacterium]|nr:MAG: sugar ABC transporter substrate-binding protein [Chloroflexota bacterium]
MPYYLSTGILIFTGVIWLGLVVYHVLKRKLLKQATFMRITILLTFTLAFVLISFFFNSVQLVLTIVGVVLPAVWQFVDGFFTQRPVEKRVAFILKAGSGYCKEVADSVTSEVRARLPKIKLDIITNSREENHNEQLTVFANAVRQVPDVIILIPPPNNTDLISTAIEAQRKGIKLITIDDIFESNEFAYLNLPCPQHVGVDFDFGGRLAAKAMMRALEGKGNIVIISGPLNSRPSQERKLAFIDEIFKEPRDIVITHCYETAWNSYEAANQIRNLLQLGQSVQGVFCCNDKLALGVVEAYRQHEQSMGKRSVDRPIIIGFDGLKEIYRALFDGDIYASVEVETDLQGKKVVDLLEHILNNQSLAHYHPYRANLIMPHLLTWETVRNRGYHP